MRFLVVLAVSLVGCGKEGKGSRVRDSRGWVM
jgi:hypothetical protein